MIDNFELVKQLISFNEEDKLFFFLQIVRRAKDHRYNNTKVKEGAIKTYFVTSKTYLDSIKEEVIILCEHYGARAYINVSAKSLQKLQKELLLKLAEYNINNTLVKPFRLINRIAGQNKANNPKWIIDIDDISSQEKPVLLWLDSYFMNEEYLVSIIPTAHGEHLITTPFNLGAFQKSFPDIDVHKNSMGTLLYFPESINS